MDTEEYRKKIEAEILMIIEEKLQARQMNAERAREIAKYILSTLHPHMDINQIHAVAQEFDDHFPELIPVVLQVSQEYDNKVKDAVTRHVGNLLKDNKIEEAHALLKKATSKQVKLSK